MAIHLAWHDLLHRRGRTSIALAGVGFAILLIFMQLGFYLACRTSAVRVHEMLDFDLMLVSARYVFIMEASPFPRDRVDQAAAVPGVAQALPLRVGAELWRNPQSGNRHDAFVLGVDPDLPPFADADLFHQTAKLKKVDTVLFDRAAHPVLGAHQIGTRSEIVGRQLEVVGLFEWGAGFVANGIFVVSKRTYQSLFPTTGPNAVELGVIRLEAGADPERVAAAIAARLPDDVEVWSRQRLEARDRAFFLEQRPIGMMFTSGVVVAFLVGAVILFQVLSSEVTNRLDEFATLKALGFRDLQIYRVVVEQGVLYCLAAFVPAAVLATGLYALVRQVARLPLEMSPGLLLAVLALSLLMCLAGALIASRRLRQAEPADLF